MSLDPKAVIEALQRPIRIASDTVGSKRVELNFYPRGNSVLETAYFVILIDGAQFGRYNDDFVGTYQVAARTYNKVCDKLSEGE